MEVKLYKPENSLLRQYIECFYTLSRIPEEKSVTYISFPSVFSMVCLNFNARIDLRGNDLTITHFADNLIKTSLICDFDNAGLVHYEGKMHEIVIYFKPLGLNAFIDKDLSSYVTSPFVHFAPFEDYKSKLSEVFSIENGKNRIQALEDYCLTKLKDFRHPFLYDVIDEMMNEGSLSSISEIALKNGISRTTLNKHFDRHICTTPSQFKKVVRFRSVVKRYQEKFFYENLADVSHLAEYFDQSHMIKDFKALTGYTPKAFFSKITNLENGQINWMFL